MINTGNPALDQTLTDISNGLFNTGGVLIGDQADATCKSYAGTWMTRLRSCPGINAIMNSTDSIDIINKLAGVCKKGYDATHPSGASSISPDSTAFSGFTNFPAVIKSYLISHGIDTASGLCNPYLITVPPPYASTPVLTNSTVITKPSECECKRLHDLEDEFNLPANHSGTFSNYLLRKYGTHISQGKIDTLLALCSPIPFSTCVFLNTPITIPPVLQCSGPTKTCLECAEYDSIKTGFYSEFHQTAPVLHPETQAEIDLNHAFANYANYRTGFAKLWTAYVAFDTTCTNFSTNNDFACDTLVKLIRDFRDSRHYVVRDSNNVMQNVWFLSNAYTAPNWSLFNVKDFIHDGVLDGLPDTVTTGQVDYAVNNFNGTVCVNTKFVFEYKVRVNPRDSNYLIYNSSEQFFAMAFDNGNIGPIFNDRYASYSGFVWGTWGMPSMVEGFHEWSIVRGVLEHDSIKMYVNGVYRGQNYFPSNFTRLYWFAFSHRPAFQVDYLRFYNQYNQEIYREDFNDPTNFAFPKESGMCPDVAAGCQSDFVTYFNSHRGTSYNFTQIDSFYFAKCGIHPTPCDTVPAYPTHVNPPLLCGLADAIAVEDSIHLPDPCAGMDSVAITIGEIRYQLYVDSLRNAFDTAYNNKCLRAGALEHFSVAYTNAEYHYTLYYYDQAGNLVQTVPPEGVDARHGDNTFLNSVATARANVLGGASEASNRVVPSHTLLTNYRYNTLNQVVAQQTPDAGRSEFYYDRLGRLVVSQNAKQSVQANYSYTEYDHHGRITQVGQIDGAHEPGNTKNPAALAAWMAANEDNKRQITRTVYDVNYFAGEDPAALEAALVQKNLRNRVSYSQVFDEIPAGSDSTRFAGTQNSATYYSYDIHGNVDTLVQDYGNESVVPNMMNTTGNRFKKMVYDYDLISGKVNKVSYQPGMTDEFYHRYEYDAENRLTAAETSHDGILWERDARYEYYRHGLLGRITTGQEQVQGTDYAYTLQGWLKGVNSTSMYEGVYDMGKDGKTGSSHSNITRDAYGYALNYFTNDYTAIGGTNPFLNSNVLNVTNTESVVTAKPLYNGNIASMFVNVPKIGDAHMYGYGYDQLNRIISMDAFNGFKESSNYWSGITAKSGYKERVSYDANGNIQYYLRNGANDGTLPEEMDDLSYYYEYDGNGKLLHNRLNYVDDKISETNYSIDVDGQKENNYLYDEIGNLVQDKAEHIKEITWTVYGKIRKISKGDVGEGDDGGGIEGGGLGGGVILIGDGSADTDIDYSYDAAGNRISKRIKEGGGVKDGGEKETWYVRDASGNVMSVYSNGAGDDISQWQQREIHLYGSSRLGVFNINRDLSRVRTTNHDNEISTFERGNKFFELTNHLGNVLATVTDRRIQINTSTAIDHYEADVATANDYYPFGMQMPGRTYVHEGSYRYGFNGKENDNEVKGEGNQQDYGERAYDTRIGKWLSIDKIIKASFSSYQYSRNNPINYIDPDGNDEIHFYFRTQENLDKNGKAFTTILWSAQVIANGSKAHQFFVHNAAIGYFDNGGKGTEIFPFETGTNLPRTTSFAAAENSLPFATQVRSYLWGFGKSFTNDYEFLGKLLKISPELMDYYKNDQQTTWSFRSAEKFVGTAEFATKLLGVSETVFAIIDGYYAVKGLGKLITGARLSGLTNMKSFIESASRESKNGLTQVGRALQKHAGREGSSFADINFSGKTGNQQGLDVLNDILNSKNQLIQEAENGTKSIFDKATGRGVNVSRNGEFNGFRDIKEIKK